MQAQPRLATSALSIITGTGKHDYTVEMALSDKEREIGLMYRRAMPQNEGMFFDFGKELIVTIWMRNTVLSLDIVFIDAQGKITDIVPRAVPFSLRFNQSSAPVRYVLELNAGEAERIHAKVGDSVQHPALGNRPA